MNLRCMAEIFFNEPQEVVIEADKFKHYVSALAENVVKDYIEENIDTILLNIFPDTSPYRKIRCYGTNPSSPKEVGSIKTTSLHGRRRGVIRGWYGDFVAVVDDSECGKRAIIFEIKQGHIQLSKGQINFFNKIITQTPGVFMKKLQSVKVVIVHCCNLNIKRNKLQITFREYQYRNKKQYDTSKEQYTKLERVELNERIT